MVLTRLKRPIDIFNIAEWGVKVDRLVKTLNDHYDHYTWDNYLYRQNQIEFFKQYLPGSLLGSLSDHFWLDFYAGRIDEKETQKLVANIPALYVSEFREIKKTRKRLISEFNLSYEDEWCIERIPARVFGQEYALTSDSGEQDYRQAKRSFSEMPETLNCQDLQLILKGIANELKAKRGDIQLMNIIVHHTMVYCYAGQLGTNSPEGIHQDGMDYIVSALVIERKNISGGRSIIYGQDMKTKILETVLQSGQGILQPDRGTELWHEVTPIKCQKNYKKGYRSTIGFDITVPEEEQPVYLPMENAKISSL